MEHAWEERRFECKRTTDSTDDTDKLQFTMRFQSSFACLKFNSNASFSPVMFTDTHSGCALLNVPSSMSGLQIVESCCLRVLLDRIRDGALAWASSTTVSVGGRVR